MYPRYSRQVEQKNDFLPLLSTASLSYELKPDFNLSRWSSSKYCGTGTVYQRLLLYNFRSLHEARHIFFQLSGDSAIFIGSPFE